MGAAPMATDGRRRLQRRHLAASMMVSRATQSAVAFLAKKRSMGDATESGAGRWIRPSAPSSADASGRTDKAALISDADDGVKSPATGSRGVKQPAVAADRVHSVERLRLR
jgi:hypothetical protein